MRDELLSVLMKFNNGEVPIGVFLSELEELNKRGVWNKLTPEECEAFNNFFAWYAGMYDPHLQPRKGILGKVQDSWDQVFKGNYRVSLEEVTKKAVQLEQSLRGGIAS